MHLFSRPRTTGSCCQTQSFCMTQEKTALSHQERQQQLQSHQMMLNLNPARAEEQAEEREKRQTKRLLLINVPVHVKSQSMLQLLNN